MPILCKALDEAILVTSLQRWHRGTISVLPQGRSEGCITSAAKSFFPFLSPSSNRCVGMRLELGYVFQTFFLSLVSFWCLISLTNRSFSVGSQNITSFLLWCWTSWLSCLPLPPNLNMPTPP